MSRRRFQRFSARHTFSLLPPLLYGQIYSAASTEMQKARRQSQLAATMYMIDLRDEYAAMLEIDF